MLLCPLWRYVAALMAVLMFAPSRASANSRFETYESEFSRAAGSLHFTIIVPAFVKVVGKGPPFRVSLDHHLSSLDAGEKIRSRGNSGDIVLGVFQSPETPLNEGQSGMASMRSAKPLGYIVASP